MMDEISTSEIIERADAAYRLAREATPRERSGWLASIADALDVETDNLVSIADRETSLGVPRLQSELRRTSFQLRLLGAEIASGSHLGAVIDHEDPHWGMGPRPDIRRVNVPLGVVGVFGASNFPFAFSVAGGDTASALAAGCSVVHKIHTAHSELGRATGAIVAAALDAAGAPAGLFDTVEGREAADTLLDHPLTAAIGFTGSTAVGRMFFDRCAARPVPIPFFGELGSINPVVVTENAWSGRRGELLHNYVASFTLGMGQFCTKPGLLFVPSSVEPEEFRQLQDEIASVAVGPMLSQPIHDAFEAALALNSGIATVEVIRRAATAVGAPPSVIVIAAGDALANPEVLEREMFGPASVVVAYRDRSELHAALSLMDGQLTATIHADDGDDVADLVEILGDRTGRLLWNGWPTGVSVTYAQQHGGPYPATTAPSATSVGTASIDRFMRPVSYQGFPAALLPQALRDDNPWRIPQRVDGVF